MCILVYINHSGVSGFFKIWTRWKGTFYEYQGAHLYVWGAVLGASSYSNLYIYSSEILFPQSSHLAPYTMHHIHHTPYIIHHV